MMDAPVCAESMCLNQHPYQIANLEAGAWIDAITWEERSVYLINTNSDLQKIA